MRISHTNLYVTDQNRGLQFYTEILGFTLKQKIRMGEHHWISLTTEEGGTQLIIDPSEHHGARTYMETLYNEGIPAISFASSDLQGEVDFLKSRGVHFKTDPTDGGMAWIAVFDDTCGNWIQLHQEK